MKMKRTISALCAAAVAASMISVSAFAADYGTRHENPGSTSSSTSDSTTGTDSAETAAPSVSTSVVTNAIESGTSIVVKAESCTVSRAAVAQIAKSDTPVTFKFDNNVTITIDPETVKKVGTVDLGVDISANESENAIVIDPAMSGEFGLTMEITIPKAKIPANVDVKSAHLYYVDDNGNMEDYGPVTVNSDGSISFELNHASSYIISSEDDAVAENVAAGAGVSGDGVICE